MFNPGTHSKKRRILLVVRWPVGGIRTFLRYVYKDFDPQLWHFTIIAPQHDELKALAVDLGECDVELVLTSPKPSAFEFGLTIFRQLLRKRYDLVHSHGFISAVCATLPSRMLLKNHIITSHDVFNAGQFKGGKGKFAQMVLHTALRMATMIHSVSHDAQNNLLSFFPDLSEKRLVTIPNGIEVDRFLKATPRDIRRECGTDDAFLIGFFGRFMGQKGFRYLVDAIEMLSGNSSRRKFLVLAYGGGGFIDREKRSIRKRGLEEYFRFMPFEPNVASAIKALDVVVMPSLWEACPLLPMETLVCGTPLIATDCIGLREVVRDSAARIIPPRNGKAICEAISEVMATDVKAEAVAYVPQAVKRYDVKKQIQELKSVYEKILASSKLLK